MSFYEERGSSDMLDMSVTLGKSFDNGGGMVSPIRSSFHCLPEPPTPVFKTKLPPAVATVPPDHIRSYLHQKKVNHYLVGNKLGEGSFAKVKEAFHIMVGEKVAMKIIDKKKAQQDPYVAKNFRREAKLLQMVRHPNILHLFEVIETDSSFYLITELCSGGELMKYIYKKGHLDEHETRKYMRHIVSAVDHLHKAGIIHRDLKVENLLLDSNKDLKLIDFGLSNEEFVQGEYGMIHCNTQCGSPAYAAPELLGHKAYGPEVDIWSIGVNMYAMLTGCLPYTVEPFNITALHAKMLENKMNPIPDHLSKNCKDLLRNLLKSNPDERLKMSEIMAHPWMNEGHALPFGPAPYPNRLDILDLDEDIVQHMVCILKVKISEEELNQELVSNRATSNAAIYYLLVARLARYKRECKTSHVRSRRSRVSRDYGFYEDEDNDASSVASMPTRRPGPPHKQPRNPRRPSNQYRPSMNPSVEEIEVDKNEEDGDVPNYDGRRRRSTMPEMMLKDDIEALRKRMREKEEAAARAMIPSFQRREPSGRQDEQSTSTGQRSRPTRRTSPNQQYLAPIHQPLSSGRRNNQSTAAGLNEVREKLRNQLPSQGPVREAWRSNPASRAGSRQPSRATSRHPSGVTRPSDTSSTNVHTRTVSYDDHASNGDKEELLFHEVSSSQTLPRSHRVRSRTISERRSSTLPSITNPQQSSENTSSSLNQSRAYSDTWRHGPMEFSDALIAIETAASGLKIRDVERRGYNSVVCSWNGIKIQVFVNKEEDSFRISYSWLSGGNNKSFMEKRDKLAKRIKL